MLAYQAFRATAERSPDKLALVDGSARIVYGDLLGRVGALARALRDDGVAPGDRVACLLENSVEFAVGVLATLAVGAVFVPVGPLAKPDKLAFILRDTRAVALLTHEQLSFTWRLALDGASGLHSVRLAAATQGSEEDTRIRGWPAATASQALPEGPGRADDLAFLIYTSGTTGVPKGVMLTHANAASAWTSITSWLGLRPDDVVGLALPPAFIYGLGNLMMSLMLGATVVLERSAAFPLRLAEMLVAGRVTVYPGVPMQFASLLGLQNLARFDFSAVRLLTNAAAALPVAHVQRLKAVFPNAGLVNMYGLTECIRASYLPSEEIDRRPGSVGRGVPNQIHWLVDESGQRLPAGSTGELVVSGPHVMAGYWQRPLETDERLTPGPADGERTLRTGDIFRSDADGYLYFVSRKDDIIKTRGETVAPREVENAIYLLEGVTGCAVVGLDDESLGQALKAYVTLKPGCALGARDIVRHCRESLESYKVPKIVAIVEDLPRTESGKVRHASLRG
jgi:long-chain acyl-CoA synthetase